MIGSLGTDGYARSERGHCFMASPTLRSKHHWTFMGSTFPALLSLKQLQAVGMQRDSRTRSTKAVLFDASIISTHTIHLYVSFPLGSLTVIHSMSPPIYPLFLSVESTSSGEKRNLSLCFGQHVIMWPVRAKRCNHLRWRAGHFVHPAPPVTHDGVRPIPGADWIVRVLLIVKIIFII